MATHPGRRGSPIEPRGEASNPLGPYRMGMLAHGFRVSDDPDLDDMEPDECGFMTYSVVPIRTTTLSAADVVAAVALVVAIVIAIVLLG